MAFTFHKSERLCSKNIIEQLFIKGSRGFSQFPFRFSWVPIHLDSPSPVQVLIVVSKRNFPKAHQRNQVKRQIRELYRLNKSALYDTMPNGKQCALMVSYIAKEKILYHDLSKTFRQAIIRLSNELQKTDQDAIHPADKNL